MIPLTTGIQVYWPSLLTSDSSITSACKQSLDETKNQIPPTKAHPDPGVSCICSLASCTSPDGGPHLASRHWEASSSKEGSRGLLPPRPQRRSIICSYRAQSPVATPREGSYLGATASHDVLRDGIDLVLHLNLLESIVCYSHPKHTEVGPSQVQSQELSMFCREKGHY